jgi:hypothetical protein
MMMSFAGACTSSAYRKATRQACVQCRGAECVGHSGVEDSRTPIKERIADDFFQSKHLSRLTGKLQLQITGLKSETTFLISVTRRNRSDALRDATQSKLNIYSVAIVQR